MAPFNLGGEMIRSVSMERTTWNELPYKFEAGTPAIAEAVGFGAAVDYVLDAGLAAIEAHERDLVEYTLGRLGESFRGSRPTGRRRSTARASSP